MDAVLTGLGSLMLRGPGTQGDGASRLGQQMS